MGDMDVRSPSDEGTSTTSPTYENPPVVETALGIQFDDLRGFKAVDFGLYAERIGKRYPIVEDQPRLPQIIETFPLRPQLPRLEIGPRHGSERVWYKDTVEGSKLIQLQSDRFGFNWRRTAKMDPYPRYSTNESECLTEFEAFLAFCNDRKLPAVQPDICEVVYVNRIAPEKGETAVGLLETVFTGLQWSYATDFLGSPEMARFDRVYEIGEKQGRLYAEATIAVDKEQRQPFVYLKMTARVLHPKNQIATVGDIGEVEASLRLAHEWVVRGFESLTDPVVQRDRWGKRS